MLEKAAPPCQFTALQPFILLVWVLLDMFAVLGKMIKQKCGTPNLRNPTDVAYN